MERHERDERANHDWQNSRMSLNPSRSAVGGHRRNDESWVEISSQPSSSSLSSIGDEIITTGLRVGGSVPARRRRVQPPVPRSYHADQTAIYAGTSSQEEYEESESEEDGLLTSSTEAIHPATQSSLAQQTHIDSEDSDDDENSTALGQISDDPVFRPQPNAFSHPPATFTQRRHSANSVPAHPHSGVRPSLSQRSQTRVHRGPPNFMSPSYQADNDAALRASLTTLLSCAAAARGLPKRKEDLERQGAAPSVTAGIGPSAQPMELRILPESELLSDKPADSPPKSRTSATSSPNLESKEKGKRVATNHSRTPRAAKKKKTAAGAEDAFISPTLMTWVVSAGVVVLVSVVGFGAGYVIGREVGRQEALAAGAGLNASTVADSSSCGREVIRSSGGSLRRFKWGSTVGRSVVA